MQIWKKEKKKYLIYLKMIKKILLVFLLLLCACSKKQDPKSLEYIDPVRDVFIFSELDSSVQERIKKANANKEYKNYQFKMHGADVFLEQLTDINDNPINLKDYDNLIFEVVSVTCNHCRNQLQHINEFVSRLNGTFIQYFNVGTKQEILDLYKTDNIDIPENLIIIGQDDRVDSYIRYDLGLQMYPTLLCYKNGKISFCEDGEIGLEEYDSLLDVAFINPLEEKDLLDENGNNVIELNRSVDDVKNSLSIENQNKINSIDNDSFTSELTYNLMGKKVDYSNVSETSGDIYFSDVDDYTVYEDKQLVLIYTYLKNKNEVTKVEFINDLIKSNSDVEYLVVLIEGIDNSSNVLKNMGKKFDCPVISNLGKLPYDFTSYGINSYPSAVFINYGTFTGAYSNIENTEKFNAAINMFLGDNCIAYKSNN